MKINSVESLAFPDVKLITFARFRDHRGYFTEHYRQSDIFAGNATAFLRRYEFVQFNESFSRAGTIRGLHFQWEPPVGKLVRAVHGHLVDLILDIRKGSPTYGKIIAVDLPANPEAAEGRWIWVPPGFAHGVLMLADTTIEYLCTGEWNPRCEEGISPLCDELDWSLCDPKLRAAFAEVAAGTPLISDKDRQNMSLSAWTADPRSDAFAFAEPLLAMAYRS